MRRSGIQVSILVLMLVPAGIPLWAAGAAEEAGAARAGYLAERGVIVPESELLVDSFIGSLDYTYPDPEGDFGITLYPGHRQIPISGRQETLVLGLQGKRYPFDELPPLNLVLVVDRSGSMAGPE